MHRDVIFASEACLSVLVARVIPSASRGYSHRVQGYLVHKKSAPLMTLQKDYAQGRTVPLGGRLFLMSEVPL